jgi:hypothetical protein
MDMASEQTNDEEKHKRSTAIIVALITGICGLLATIGAAVVSSWDKFFPPGGDGKPPVEISITSPREQERVERKIRVSGISKNVPQMEEMWLYVFPTDEQKYYLTKIKPQPNQGTWNVEEVLIGAEGESGTTFRLGVLLVSAKVDADIKKDQRGLEQGLDKLPTEKKFKEITIHRK